jgi:hypothetical protein
MSLPRTLFGLVISWLVLPLAVNACESLHIAIAQVSGAERSLRARLGYHVSELDAAMGQRPDESHQLGQGITRRDHWLRRRTRPA